MHFCFSPRLFSPALALFFCVLASAPTALAQRVFWADSGTGDPADIQLIFENCKPSAAPVLPELATATFNYRGQSSQTQIINFSRTSLVILSYRLQIRSTGQVTIPTFAVQTSEGELSVPTYTTGTVQPGPEADIKARLATRKTTVWAGEVFPLVYSIDVARRNFSNFADAIQWDAPPLVAEDWAEPVATETMQSGELRLNIGFATRAYAKSPGPLRLNPLRQLVTLNLGLAGGGFGFFQQQRIEPVTLTTNQPEIQVQPLPLPAPANTIGAVGNFALDSKVVPLSAAVGEPITWTLTLSGTGNWPDIAGLPPRSVSADFQALQPPAKRKLADKKLFDGTLTEDVVLIPTRPGTYTLGAFEIHTFDPETGHYRQHHIAETTITVTAAATGANAGTAASMTGDSESLPPPSSRSAEAPPTEVHQVKGAASPSGLIREASTASQVARLPAASLGQVAARATIPFGAVAATWLVLALRRARQSDPLRPRRAALAKVPATLTTLRDNPNDSQALLAWQQLSTRAHGIAHAAPTVGDFPEGEWRTLWTESEHALYRETTPLPSDWLARAEAAHAALAKEIPGTAWASAFRKPNLLPWAAALALVFALSPHSAHAGDDAEALLNRPLHERIPYPKKASSKHALENSAQAAYSTGDFAEAESGWRAAVTAQPSDWAARHNLALALAQQDRWAEAAAHATAAFVQNPRSEVLRWNLAIAYSKAGYRPAEIRPALGGKLRPRFAQLASPSEWECVLIGGTSLIALALLLPLLRSYGLLRYSQHHKAGLQREARPKKGSATPIALLISGVLFAALALAGRQSYGLAAHPRAALVWRSGTLYSIPTEGDIAQQTTPLSAGTIGVAEKPFLGWVKLRFSNGQTGWARETELVPLWESLPQN